MQSLYSIGSMAPSLCKMFVSFKSKTLIHVKKKKKRTYRERHSGCILEAWNVDDPPQMDQGEAADSPPGVCMQLPRLSQQGSPPRRSINCIMGRNSDVVVGFPRLSTSSSSCYERLSVEYHQGEGQDLPRLAKLGVVSDRTGVLARQDSSMSLGQHRDSSCSGTSFVSSTSSRLKGAYGQQRNSSKKQPHIGELFAGNQFLTHLTAVPPVFASPCEHAHLMPSSGLVDASIHCRDADLKDRIILFL